MRRLLPLVIVAALLLGACSPEITLLTRQPDSTPTTESPSGQSTAAPAPTRTPSPSPTPGLRLNPDLVKGLEVEAWVSGDVSGLGPLAADFNGSNPWGVKISLVSYPNLNLLAGAVAASLESDSRPDIVLALPEQLLGWSDSLLDLTPYAANAEFGVAQQAIQPAFLEQSNLDGIQYGIPVVRSGRYLFYNVTWARELGFDTAPQTWEDFRAQACAANATWKADADPTNDGFGGLALEVTSNWQTPYGWIRALGGEVFAEGAYAFASAQNIAALQKLADLRAEGCAWLPSTLTNFEHLAARKALFISGGLGDLTNQRVAFSTVSTGSTTVSSADEWTVIAFPGERLVVPVYGLDMAVFQSDVSPGSTSGSGRELAAWLFIQWLLKPENQARLARASGLFPVSQAGFDLLQGDLSANPQKGAAAELLAQAVGYPRSADWGLANKVLADGFLYLFRAFPNASAESVLRQMDTTVGDLLK
jgi:ABC-type glycerol-3-phosphate transport system substrate-binding protein